MAISMNPDAAATLGLKALGWLVNSPDHLVRFLNLSGLATHDLRDRAEDPVFLGAVLDFLLSDDALVTGFCEADGIDPRQVHVARHVLEQA